MMFSPASPCRAEARQRGSTLVAQSSLTGATTSGTAWNCRKRSRTAARDAANRSRKSPRRMVRAPNITSTRRAPSAAPRTAPVGSVPRGSPRRRRPHPHQERGNGRSGIHVSRRAIAGRQVLRIHAHAPWRASGCSGGRRAARLPAPGVRPIRVHVKCPPSAAQRSPEIFSMSASGAIVDPTSTRHGCHAVPVARGHRGEFRV